MNVAVEEFGNEIMSAVIGRKAASDDDCTIGLGGSC
jgi:hypothetical protein